VPDAHYEHARLVSVYDALDSDRSDLDVYLALVRELGARRVLDIGCGTGTFALLPAAGGVSVVGLDPAEGSLCVARSKPGADAVRWLHGDAHVLPPLEVDLVTMTGNAAQAIVDPSDWSATLTSAFRSLRPGGHLVFETRDPERRAWLDWTRQASPAVTTIDGVGEVATWGEVTQVAGPLVSFRQTYEFASDGEVLTSDSTLRFRDRAEVEADLDAQGFELSEVRDAPDRPGHELVFISRRPDS